jgi:hypothetical protein
MVNSKIPDLYERVPVGTKVDRAAVTGFIDER